MRIYKARRLTETPGVYQVKIFTSKNDVTASSTCSPTFGWEMEMVGTTYIRKEGFKLCMGLEVE